jgi:hypothetical protein
MENKKEIFDSLLKDCSIKWIPWVGENYFSEESKLLFVGESHYSNEINDPNDKHSDTEYTKKVVEQLGIKYKTNNKKSATIFRNLNYSILGRQNSLDERQNYYSKIAFYNFIQTPMNTIKKRPSIKEIEDGWDTFFKLISVLNPDKVIFIGSSVLSGLKYFLEKYGFEESKLKTEHVTGKQNNRNITIKNNNKTISINFIKHTSSFFSWAKWNTYFKKINLVN